MTFQTDTGTKAFSPQILAIDDLRSVKPSANNNIVNLVYHTVAGDNGGGAFIWDAASTENDDNGTIIQVNEVSTGRWKRQFFGNLVDSWFGLVGNGSDETALLQSVINIASNLNKKLILKKGAVYGVTNAVLGSSAISLNGLSGLHLSAETSGTVTIKGLNFVYTTFTVSSSVLTLATTAPTDGTPVSLTTSGTLPGGVGISATYYVRDSSGSTCKLTTVPGGSAITLTGSGTGTHHIAAGQYTLFRGTNVSDITIEGIIFSGHTPADRADGCHQGGVQFDGYCTNNKLINCIFENFSMSWRMWDFVVGCTIEGCEMRLPKLGSDSTTDPITGHLLHNVNAEIAGSGAPTSTDDCRHNTIINCLWAGTVSDTVVAGRALNIGTSCSYNDVFDNHFDHWQHNCIILSGGVTPGNFAIEGNEIIGNTFTEINSGTARACWFFNGCRKNTFAYNSVNGCTGTAVEVSNDSSNNIIEGNQIDRAGWPGLRIPLQDPDVNLGAFRMSGVLALCDANVFRGNVVTDSAATGFVLENFGPNTIIENNVFDGMGINSAIANQPRRAIWITWGNASCQNRGIVISGNFIRDCGDEAIVVEGDSAGVAIYNNTISNFAANPTVGGPIDGLVLQPLIVSATTAAPDDARVWRNRIGTVAGVGRYAIRVGSAVDTSRPSRVKLESNDVFAVPSAPSGIVVTMNDVWQDNNRLASAQPAITTGLVKQVMAGNIAGYTTITNASVDGYAAIAGTKISPDFGSQNITTTGLATVGNATVNNTLKVVSGVRIGDTSSPLQSLDIVGTIRVTGGFFRSDNAGVAFGLGTSATQFFQDHYQFFTTNSQPLLDINKNTSSSQFWQLGKSFQTTIGFDSKTANNDDGYNLNIQAQNASGSGTTGGSLILTSGSGITNNGALILQTGGATRLTASGAGVITIANLSSGIVHSDSSGNLTSSTIVNADVSGSAAIVYSKLSLASSIVNADISPSAAVSILKLTTGSNNQVLMSDGLINFFGQIKDGYVASNAAIAVTKLANGSTTGKELVTIGSTPTWLGIVSSTLGDASVSVNVGTANQFILPTATLTQARTLTLATTSATAGEHITVIRLDTTANTFTITNGGGSGGNPYVFPVSVARQATFSYDGADWYLVSHCAIATG